MCGSCNLTCDHTCNKSINTTYGHLFPKLPRVRTWVCSPDVTDSNPFGWTFVMDVCKLERKPPACSKKKPTVI